MSDVALEANGIRVVVRRGWEVEFGELDAVPGVAARSLVHLANFALPADRGDYGSGAVEIMDGGGIFIVVMEFDRAAADTALFAGAGVPSDLEITDFSPQALQRRLSGQSGTQRFFTVGARAFGLYVVLGSGRGAALLVPEVNRTLADVEIA